MPDNERFLLHVDRRSDDECWPWLGAKTAKGYGSFRMAGQTVSAHRAAYELFVAPIPADREIDHIAENGCTRKDCVNWLRHLEPVTSSQNTQRWHDQRRLNGRITQ